MSNYIHPATVEAALRVASNLLPDDYREVTEGHGHDPLNALVVGLHNCDSVYFEVPNGDIAGMAGVHGKAGRTGELALGDGPAGPQLDALVGTVGRNVWRQRQYRH